MSRRVVLFLDTPADGGFGMARGGNQVGGLVVSIILIVILNVLSKMFDWGFVFF